MSKLYIVVRNDLPSLDMYPGKIAAQASHASASFLNTYYKLKERKGKRCILTPSDIEYIEKWLREGGDFGTTIVMEGNGQQLTDLFNSMQNDTQILMGEIIDTTYPFVFDRELWNMIQTLPEVRDEIVRKFDLQIDDEYDNDRFYKGTKQEFTCEWFFVADEQLEKFQEICHNLDICLHK